MFLSAVVVLVGGAFGSLLRFIISKVFITSSPLFTYVSLVNLIGCLLAGIVAGYMDRHIHSETLRLFLLTGIIGGFTTFSAFSLDALNLLRMGRNVDAIIYVSISVFGSIFAVVAGYMLISKVN